MVFNNPPPKTDNTPIIGELSRRLNDNTRRIRLIEDELENLDSRVNNIEQSVMDTTKELNKTVQNITEDSTELSDTVANQQADIKKINAKLKLLVTRQELREMQEYIDLMKSITSRLSTGRDSQSLTE
ncbi:MAG: hypothetical protein KAJ88_01745 [Candidatus Aenigmarchaeota archaeon]|nr:hypothetical protein [Candidatus Aenigmarchaeota archaeon]